MAVEGYTVIPISEMFPEGELASEYIELVEWQISDDRSKDHKGVLITYNRNEDALEVVPTYSARVTEWNTQPHPDDPFVIKVLPKESTYRDYLNSIAVFDLKLGEFIY